MSILGLSATRSRAVAAQQPAAQPPASTPAAHTVKRGDTLWDLAKSYLGDSFLWPEIYHVNTDQIQDPHWIYPGEVLKLPGATVKVVAVEPPESPAAAVTPSPAPTPVAAVDETSSTAETFASAAAAPAVPAQGGADTSSMLEAPRSVVASGQYTAAPWVDKRGGPSGSGYIMQAADLTGIAPADQSRMALYQQVLVAPPTGNQAPAHELYLSYQLGPLIEGFGQVVIPTGVIEVTRATQPGEAATARIVKMFGEVLQGQRLVALDISGSNVHGVPAPVSNGRAGKVRWISGEPVLPNLQDYMVVDIPRGDANPGDQVELYKPRQRPVDGSGLAIPELHVAWGQVLRVTQYGATIVITAQEQPKIDEGTAVRVAAKIP